MFHHRVIQSRPRTMITCRAKDHNRHVRKLLMSFNKRDEQNIANNRKISLINMYGFEDVFSKHEGDSYIVKELNFLSSFCSQNMPEERQVIARNIIVRLLDTYHEDEELTDVLYSIALYHNLIVL